MVVGPRYLPADMDPVDAARISPVVLRPDESAPLHNPDRRTPPTFNRRFNPDRLTQRTFNVLFSLVVWLFGTFNKLLDLTRDRR